MSEGEKVSVRSSVRMSKQRKERKSVRGSIRRNKRRGVMIRIGKSYIKIIWISRRHRIISRNMKERSLVNLLHAKVW